MPSSPPHGLAPRPSSPGAAVAAGSPRDNHNNTIHHSPLSQPLPAHQHHQHHTHDRPPALPHLLRRSSSSSSSGSASSQVRKSSPLRESVRVFDKDEQEEEQDEQEKVNDGDVDEEKGEDEEQRDIGLGITAVQPERISSPTTRRILSNPELSSLSQPSPSQSASSSPLSFEETFGQTQSTPTSPTKPLFSSETLFPGPHATTASTHPDRPPSISLISSTPTKQHASTPHHPHFPPSRPLRPLTLLPTTSVLTPGSAGNHHHHTHHHPKPSSFSPLSIPHAGTSPQNSKLGGGMAGRTKIIVPVAGKGGRGWTGCFELGLTQKEFARVD